MIRATPFALRVALIVAFAPIVAAAGTADPPRHRITVRISLLRSFVQATDRTRARPRNRAVTFRLDPRLVVDRVRIDGEGVAFSAHGGQVRAGVATDDEVDVSIDYSGALRRDDRTPDSPSFIEADGSMLIGNWYPRLSADLFSYELDVTVDDGQVAVASGRPAERRLDGAASPARFTSDAPTDDIPLLAGPYHVVEKMRRDTILRAYLHDADAALAELYLRKVGGYLDHFENTIGPYAHAAFHVVSSPIPVGFGFPGIAYLSRIIIPLPYVPETSLGHEVLHSWWGNGVRVAGGTGNWAEGLTTFQSDYGFSEAASDTEARAMRLRWLREYAVLPTERDSALTSFRGREHTASQVVGYHKAAFVFLMLRDSLGQPAFDAALRRFWSDHRGGSADWSDLRRCFEAKAGRPLEAFFTQWIELTGAPSLAVRDARVEASGSAFVVHFTLDQSAPAYQLDIPVRIDTPASQHLERVALHAAQGTFALTVAEPPTRLLIDPDLRVFRRLAPEEIPPILREVAFDAKAATIVSDTDPELRRVARAIAERLFERPPQIIAEDRAGSRRALLIVGSTAATLATRAAIRLPAPAAELPAGTARAWAARTPAGQAVVVVEGDPAALQQIAAPLPHYGSQSFVVFDGPRVIAKGVWPPASSPLIVDLPPPTQPE